MSAMLVVVMMVMLVLMMMLMRAALVLMMLMCTTLMFVMVMMFVCHIVFLYINAVVLFDFAHYEGALNGADIVDVAQFVEHKLLILLHVACAYF